MTRADDMALAILVVAMLVVTMAARVLGAISAHDQFGAVIAITVTFVYLGLRAIWRHKPRD